MADGTLLLSNVTALVGNSASGRGDTLLAEGGVSTYSLPAPPGHWIAGLACYVYRSACPRDKKGNVLDSNCPLTHEECSLKLNETDSKIPVRFNKPGMAREYSLSHSDSCWPRRSSACSESCGASLGQSQTTTRHRPEPMRDPTHAQHISQSQHFP